MGPFPHATSEKMMDDDADANLVAVKKKGRFQRQLFHNWGLFLSKFFEDPREISTLGLPRSWVF